MSVLNVTGLQTAFSLVLFSYPSQFKRINLARQAAVGQTTLAAIYL